MHQVYILYSAKLNRFYIGYTSDLKTRMDFHANAENRKFTHNALDWEQFLTIDCESKIQGLAREKHIKSMKSRVYIENLHIHPEIIEKLKIQHQS